MATNSQVFGGLELYQSADERPIKKCLVASGDGTRLGIGDPVTINAGAAGQVGSDSNVICVKRANGTSDPIYGVVQSVVPLIEGTGSSDLSISYRKASTKQYVNVRPSSYQDLYSIQDDGTAALTVANVGNNAQMSLSDCDTATGLSKAYVLGTSVASGNATYPLHIVGVDPDPNNILSSNFTRWIVSLNNIYQGGGTGVAGV